MDTNSKQIDALTKLGLHLKEFDRLNPKYTKLQTIIEQSINKNAWFNQENIENVFRIWSETLEEDKILDWISRYKFESKKDKTVAIILAGNIPMVGLHDLICVWVSGLKSIVKCSSKDDLLLPYMTDFLESQIGKKYFTYQEKIIRKFDAVIATGSNNSARYFDYYFKKYPNIIRKNRNGIAVLSGKESVEDLNKLCVDILQYFGLGCRNISKIYIPIGFDLDKILKSLRSHESVVNNFKYLNNYNYHKTILLLNHEPFKDNGFFILKENKKIAAPIACLHYEYYKEIEGLRMELSKNIDWIQCIVSDLNFKNAIPFGESQKPSLFQYADEIDTLEFLISL